MGPTSAPVAMAGAADAAAFGASAVADAALPVPRRPVHRGVGPHAVVSAKAVVFGKAYAKDNFGKEFPSREPIVVL